MEKKKTRDCSIRVKLTQEEYDRIHRESEIQHRTMSEIVRMCLDKLFTD